MSDTSSPFLRQIVHQYLQASEAVLANTEGASETFVSASHDLLSKDGKLTDDEMALIQDMLIRVSAKLGPSRKQNAR